MGYMRHHAIIVSSWDREQIDAMRLEAITLAVEERLASLISPLVQSAVNGYSTFVVAPDGSKEGWGHSDAGDRLRERIVETLIAAEYADGSSRFAWAVVRYGDDNGDDAIEASSDQRYTAYWAGQDRLGEQEGEG